MKWKAKFWEFGNKNADQPGNLSRKASTLNETKLEIDQYGFFGADTNI